MARIKPFKGVRPPKEIVEEVASMPYDVLNSVEARKEVAENEKSFYRIIKPEVDFEEETDEHAPRVYQRAAENFQLFQNNGWLVQDKKEMYYLYAQTMKGKRQCGWVVCSHVDDYFSGKIKKHELTRKDKEEDRMKHIMATNANMGPVFLAFRNDERLAQMTKLVVNRPKEYDFVSNDGVRHQLWLVNDPDEVEEITFRFSQIPELYIADGHHRSAAAALTGAALAKQNPRHTGYEEYNFFMTVCFPHNQLNIIDYNRLVKDLNGLSHEEFIQRLSACFDVSEAGCEMVRPTELHHFSIYLDGKCYFLVAKPEFYDDADPIGVLDVTISSNYILDEILGIKDLRTDKRIDFVGGIRGLSELKKRVDSGGMRLALALHPVTMRQLMDIADSGNIMPPKTTWFEPKLRSGLVIHKLE